MQLLRTKHEAADVLSISVRQLETYMQRGEIAVTRLGRRCVRIEQAELVRFVKRMKAQEAVSASIAR
jgi:excisionase family DNA binding protein